MQVAPVKPVLVFAWGNPSRGDDGLGPALFERLEAERVAGHLPGVDLLTDYQLQVEHALDLQGRDRILFIDASMSVQPPCEIAALHPERDASYTTHAMTPGAVLAVYEQISGRSPPPAWLLSIRGYAFELGAPLTPQAAANLQEALALAREFLGKHDPGQA